MCQKCIDWDMQETIDGIREVLDRLEDSREKRTRYVVEERYFDSGHTSAEIIPVEKFTGETSRHGRTCDTYYTYCDTLAEARKTVDAVYNA